MMRLTKRQAEAWKLKWKKPAKRGTKCAKRSDENKLFFELCKAHGLNEPIVEYHFAPPRKWRFDFLFDGLVALVTWDNEDARNEAMLLDYIVFRVTEEDLQNGYALRLVKRALFGDCLADDYR